MLCYRIHSIEVAYTVHWREGYGVSVGRMADHWWWRPGWRAGRRMYTWHFTFDDQPGARDLAARYQARLAHLPGLDIVPARWLHLTTQDIGFTDEVSDGDVTKIVDVARNRLSQVGPVHVTLGPAYVTPEAILLDVHPVAELAGIRRELRAAIGDVWGSARVPDGPEWTPHVSVAYSNTMRPADSYAVALDAAAHTAAITFRAVQLIILGRDEKVYEWTTYAGVSLSADTSAAG